MPWHRLGTVSVTQNSSAVTGVNTAFAANTRIGDAFIGPDGRQYELGNVASDTVISIIPPYLGPTVAGAAYAVTPVQGYQKGLADQVRDWVNTYGAKLAALGTTGNYDILPPSKGGTGIADLSAFAQTLLNDADAAAGRITLAAAKSGANTDITSLGGLTSALSAAQGGTGVGSIAALLSSLVTAGAYAKSNAVGTVSQSGGVPTGALFESGSNASGAYLRMLDGTQICYKRVAIGGVSIGSPAGSVFYSGGVNPGAFAATYVGIPTTQVVVQSSSGLCWSTVAGDPTTLQFGTIFIISPTSTSATITLNCIAIGRWF